MIKYRTSENDMLDWIAWKHYGKQSGAVEAILEANPGLADKGDKLPAGLVINLPEIQIK
jgi:phage tail protein X